MTIKPAAFSKPSYPESRKAGQLFRIMMSGSELTEMVLVCTDSDVGLSEQKLWQLNVSIRKTFAR